MYFKRDIWNKLLCWKNEWKNVSLEVHGARQVGKTYILKKFCQENFKKFVYINMVEKSGRDFLAVIEESQKKTWKREASSYVFDLLRTFDPAFEDTEDTVVVIDEIQESGEVYNLVREFTRELSTRFIVTGSYLGKVLDKEFFLPAGDLAQITMYPLSFAEFLDIFGLRDVQHSAYMQNHKNEELLKMFNVYFRLGGYPAVIQTYLDTNDYTKCYTVLDAIVNTFISESSRYFTVVEDFSAFRDIMLSIIDVTMKEKSGTNLIEDISKIMMKRGTNRISKNAVASAISWLRVSGVIGYADKLVDGDPSNSVSNARFYFNDIGIASYFAVAKSSDAGAVKGFLAENYVYTCLRNKYYTNELGDETQKVTGWQPAFSVYSKTGGELDFVVCGRLGGKKYGIEVKAGRNKANTGRAMLNDGLIDHLYLLEGASDGGETDGVTTLPLYLADQLQLEFNSGELVKLLSF